MTIRRNAAFNVFAGVIAAALATCIYTRSQAAQGPVDPGVRAGAPGAGTPLDGLSADETAFFQNGLAKFVERRQDPPAGPGTRDARPDG